MKNSRNLFTIISVGLVVAVSSLYPLSSAASQPKQLNSLPLNGKVLKLTSGDLMCYVDLIGAGGKKYHLGADFEICNQTKFLNKQVKLTYKYINVNDCQSSEVCGMTRNENLIVKMKLSTSK